MTYVLSVVSVEFQVFSGIMQGERPGHVAETWVNGSSWLHCVSPKAPGMAPWGGRLDFICVLLWCG